jgi:hypothetical protein
MQAAHCAITTALAKRTANEFNLPDNEGSNNVRYLLIVNF